jgi:excisionase family DNA binding protein
VSADAYSPANAYSPADSSGPEAEQLLTPGEVAQLFRVDPKTVARWAATGHLGSVRTLGGRRRYRESEVQGLLQMLTIEATNPITGD